MVPGRKFCTRTSACPTSLARTSRPASLLTSIDSERLPRFEEINSAENSPSLSIVARLRREQSIPVEPILKNNATQNDENIDVDRPQTQTATNRTPKRVSETGQRRHP